MARNLLRRSTVLSLALLLASGASRAADVPSAVSISRLVELCKLWGAVKYTHPALVTQPIDWDAALVRAIPRVREANTDAEYRKALEQLLATLNDPATRIVDRPADQEEAPSASSRPVSWQGKVLVLTFAAIKPGQPPAPLLEELAKAEAVVADLRGRASSAVMNVIDELYDELGGADLRVPAMRVVFHDGYAPQRGVTSGGYHSGMKLLGGQVLHPRKPVPARKLVFIADETSYIPSLVPALQAVGRGRLLAQGELRHSPRNRVVSLSAGRVALVRAAELEGGPVRADAAVRDPAKAIEEAVALVRTGWKPRPRPLQPLVGPAFAKEKPYEEMLAPDLPHRLLALFRLWNVIGSFYPYRHLIGDWDAVLPELIPRFEAAEDARSYAQAVLEASTRVPDGHTSLGGHPELKNILGSGPPVLIVRRIQGKPVVVSLLDAGKAGVVEVGDVVLQVGGENVETVVDRLRPYLTASTKPALENRLLMTAMRPRGKDAVDLVLEGKTGARKTVTLAAKQPDQLGAGEPWRVVEPGVGYVDMKRLETGQVDAMFAALRDTKALVFDMRGYPRGTAWSIAPRINVRKARIAAVFRRPLLQGGEGAPRISYYEQAIGPSKDALYQGKTVMLIDDRAISQSEHTGLFFEAAAGTTFIGSPSAGANGDVTSFPLPGGIWFNFTGHDVRHADGRPLQRVGLTPQIRVEPTIAGLRAGKDEVLERALQWIRSGR
jgi:C-terminal processing protease CtpA/Prc